MLTTAEQLVNVVYKHACKVGEFLASASEEFLNLRKLHILYQVRNSKGTLSSGKIRVTWTVMVLEGKGQTGVTGNRIWGPHYSYFVIKIEFGWLSW